MEHVAKNGDTTGGIVEIHRHGSVHAWSLDMMKIVVAYDGASGCPIPAHVKGSDISGFPTDMMDLVELDEMIVSSQLYGVVGSVMDEVVSDGIACAIHTHGGTIGAVETAEVMDVIVRRIMFSGTKCSSVAAGQSDAPFTGFRDMASLDPVVCSTLNSNAPAAGVTDGASPNAIMTTALKDHGCTANRFDGNSTQCHPRGVVHGNECSQHRDHGKFPA